MGIWQRIRRGTLSLALSGCGRLGFDVPLDGSLDAGSDAPPGTVRTARFGETGTATYAGVTTDTMIAMANADLNHGARALLRMDADTSGTSTQVSLLRFDLSALPTSAVAMSAVLTLWTDSDRLGFGTIRFHAVLQPWDEGNADGASGFANWMMATSDAAWAGPGASSTARDPVIAAEVAPMEMFTRYDVALSTSVVQDWIRAPGNNYGLVLVPSETQGQSCTCVSSEGTPVERRPLLTVEYVLP